MWSMMTAAALMDQLMRHIALYATAPPAIDLWVTQSNYPAGHRDAAGARIAALVSAQSAVAAFHHEVIPICAVKVDARLH